jgi:hypothetical protein
LPPFIDALQLVIRFIGRASDAYADWVAASEESEKQLSTDIRNIKTAVDNAVQDIKTAISNVVSSIKSLFNDLATFFNSSLDLTGLTDRFNEAIDPIQGAIQGLIDDVDELLDRIADISVPQVNVPSVGDIGGGDDSSGSDDGSGGSSSPGPGSGGVAGPGGSDGDGSGVDDGTSGSGGGGGLDSGFSGGRPTPSPGGGAIGLASGGLVESMGRATLHAGERVIPEAQVSERGGIESSGVTIENLTVNADSRSGGRAAGKALKRELKRFDI